MGTSTIKSSGGDYTSLSAWEAAKNGNIIGLGPEIAECYDLDDTTDVAISGWATSASDYIEIKAVTAARCNGSTRAQTGNTYRLSSSSTAGVIRNSQSHVRISGIEVKSNIDALAFQQVSAASGSDIRLTDCVFSSNGASASTTYTLTITTAAANITVRNCLITGKRRGIDCRSSFTVTVDHCTIYTTAADLGIVADTELTCTNTYVGGHTTQDFWTGGSAPTGSHNASSDTSASTDYTSSLTSKAAANQFTNPSISDSTMDFTLKATADLKDAGTGSYATDIAGNTRSGTVDIGAFEYISAGGGTTVNGALEAISLSTFGALVSSDRALAAAVESILLSTNAATIQANVDTDISAALESIGLSTYPADLSLTVNASAESITLSTFLASISGGTDINASLESIQLSANAATLQLGNAINAQTESVTLSTSAALVSLNRSINAGLESIVLTELAAQVSISQVVNANVESITLTEFGATIVLDTGISATLESLTLSTFSASITSPTTSIVIPGLEYTIQDNRLHFTMPVSKLHFTFGD